MVETTVPIGGDGSARPPRRNGRRTGRPDQQASEQLVQHILDVATEHFIELGFAGASLEGIAQAAGAGKQTLYRRFSSKPSLFLAVIDRESRLLIEGAKAAAADGGVPLEALRRACREMLEFVLRPRMIALQRILIAESVRFPELGRHVLESCLAPYNQALGALIEAAAAAGQLSWDSGVDLRDHLFGLMVAAASQKALLDPNHLATGETRDAYFDEAWRLFLRATAPRP